MVISDVTAGVLELTGPYHRADQRYSASVHASSEEQLTTSVGLCLPLPLAP